LPLRLPPPNPVLRRVGLANRGGDGANRVRSGDREGPLALGDVARAVALEPTSSLCGNGVVIKALAAPNFGDAKLAKRGVVTTVKGDGATEAAAPAAAAAANRRCAPRKRISRNVAVLLGTANRPASAKKPPRRLGCGVVVTSAKKLVARCHCGVAGVAGVKGALPWGDEACGPPASGVGAPAPLLMCVNDKESENLPVTTPENGRSATDARYDVSAWRGGNRH
jgi:hypothetical protein